MSFQTWVRLAGRRLPYAELRAEPDRFSGLLSRAWADKDAECLCRTPALPLVTRCRSGHYSLAVWPHGGPRHNPMCAFFKVDGELSGQKPYTGAAIREGDDGGVAISFAGPLAASTRSDALSREPVERSVYPGIGRSRIGLLGILHWLWEESRLTTWHPTVRDRSWADVVQALRSQAEICTINSQPGSDVLYVVPPWSRGSLPAFDRFLSNLDGRSALRRGFVVGELAHRHEAEFGYRYELVDQRARQVMVRKTLHERLTRSYRHAVSRAATEAGGRRVLLAYVERSRTGYAVAVDAAIMLTNQQWIPADSSYEVLATDALVRAGRAFLKPCRYDGDAVFPDYVFLDQPQSFMEVWGREDDAEYRRRKLEKLRHYRESGARLLEWSAPGPMPSLALAG
ncbi:DUF1173 family protein [Nocardia africana]|uniref:DUF1173 family protein n=2 Tax=Nocardia africana TaxID=134964 RepID=UPI0007C6F5A1|nr:DUF1173 family protein [Nocardia africana]